MLEAGIIHKIHPNEVRFVAQTVLAQKTHEGQGRDIETLKYISKLAIYFLTFSRFLAYCNTAKSKKRKS